MIYVDTVTGKGKLTLIKAGSLVRELAGSVSVPKHLLSVDPDYAIKKAKTNRFGCYK